MTETTTNDLTEMDLKKAKIKAYGAEYRAANPEKIKARSAKYYEANAEKVKAYQAAYRAAKKAEATTNREKK